MASSSFVDGAVFLFISQLWLEGRLLVQPTLGIGPILTISTIFFRYRVVFSQTVYMCIIIESFEKPCSSMQFIKALSGSTSHVRIISGAASHNKIIVSSYTNITYMYSNKLVIFSGIGLYYDDTCVLQAYSAPCVESYQNTTLHTQDIESQQRN